MNVKCRITGNTPHRAYVRQSRDIKDLNVNLCTKQAFRTLGCLSAAEISEPLLFNSLRALVFPHI